MIYSLAHTQSYLSFFTDMSFIVPHLLENNDFHPDEGLVTSTDHPVEDFTVDDGIQTSAEGWEGILRVSTEKIYNSYRKKLAGFLGTAFDGKKTPLPKEMYTDDNVSRFVVKLEKDSRLCGKFALFYFCFSITVLYYIVAPLLSYSRKQYIPIVIFLDN